MLHHQWHTRALLVVCSFGATAIDARSQTGTDSLDQALASFFQEHPPELFRYGGLAMYGEEAASFDQERIAKELKLLELVSGSERMEHPTGHIWALCHDVLIHSPVAGREFLSSLNASVADQDALDPVFLELLFAGEYGEKLAVSALRYDDQDSDRPWATYLSRNAIYLSSIPAIEQELRTTQDTLVQKLLLSALMYIGDPRSLDLVGLLMDGAGNDGVQAKAIFVYTELAGYDGIERLQQVKTVGPRAVEEKTGVWTG